MTSVENVPAASAHTCYESDLAWLDKLLELEILRLRTHYELSLDELRGLYISDRQVDEVLRRKSNSPATAGPVDVLQAEPARLKTLRAGDSRLQQVGRRFDLTVLETDVLMLALAPEVSLKYETLYAYLNNDITRKHMTVDLAVRLLGASASVEQVRETMRYGGRLFSTGLLEWIDGGSDRRALLSHGFALATPITQFLLGLPADDPRLPARVQQLSPAVLQNEAAKLAPPTCRVVETFARRHPVEPGLVVCTGESAAEQMWAAGGYAAYCGYGIIALPVATAVADAAAWPALCRRLTLLASLSPAIVVLIEEADALPRESNVTSQYVRAVHDLTSSGVSVLLAARRQSPWTVAVGEIPFVELALPEASAADRGDAWQIALKQAGLHVDTELTQEIGHRFVLSYARIRAAAATAAHLCAVSDGGEDTVRKSLWHAARRHSSQSLAQLTTCVTKPYKWDHLVLPETTLRRVREVASAIRQRDRVFHNWGMAERTGSGNGLMVLFSGASGTGKTMTAAIVASDLELELYRIDLASIVSKYIGETEKNLDRIFEAARRSNGILLFDEADALLGKRSEVKDAHDRYANIEIAYLLQKMEDHDGVVILATNLSKNLDQAFARRMHYVVEFPRPDAGLRERLWRGIFPPETPLAADVDLRFLAEQFEISGGEIQSVALDAAFLASAGNEAIQMLHLVQAMARYQLKQGNPPSVTSFRQYYGMVRSG
jgi:AAA+ superfamily predicted ATPase